MATVDLLSLADQSIRPFESIPVIDISGLSGPADSKAQVASAIRDACIHVGFFYVKNHGVDETVIKSAVDASRRFYDLSLEEKMKLNHSIAANFRGYFPIGDTRRKYARESFAIGAEIDPSLDASTNKPNVWPPEDVIPGFQEAVLKYYQEVAKLGSKLLSAFALALNLSEDFFADKVHVDDATMYLIHSPPGAEVIEYGEAGVGSHTDFGFFTILLQDDNVPVLQVLNASDQWIDAKPIPGTFVINIANQLSRWTNDIFRSTVHRAINSSGARRYSIPFFICADENVKIEVFPSCVSESRPARYEPFVAGEHVKWRLERSYPPSQR